MTATATPTTTAIAQELVSLCRTRRNMDAINKLYSPNIESVEAAPILGMPAVTKGIDAIRGKNQWWSDNIEVHSYEVQGPYVNGDQFAVRFAFDTTQKSTGQRGQNEEIALYTVKDGQIVREQFFQVPSGA